MPKTKQFDETEVLRKARNVFWVKGYNGTSMDELVRATGLSRSSIYDTFGDKHGLFVRSIQLYGQEEREALAKIMQNDFSPKKKIHLLFKGMIGDILEDKDNKGCFIVNIITELSCLDKQVTAMASEEMARSEEALFQWVRQGQAAGEINKSHSARTLARHLQNTIYGLRVTGKAGANRAILEDIAKAALSVLD
ncbi:TetR/AcrR family transcriptional regulator [Puia dinghuensis]|nr:TetR/AcrR family transcriptional regulator [Puia dinghuensis]